MVQTRNRSPQVIYRPIKIPTDNITKKKAPNVKGAVISVMVTKGLLYIRTDFLPKEGAKIRP